MKYVGCDISKEMVVHAKEKYTAATFLCGDFLGESAWMTEKFDFVFASGIFFLQHECWDDYFLTMLEKMFDNCIVAVGLIC